MTCREKLQQEHPELVDDKWIGGCDGCPDEYGYLEVPDFCGGHEKACTRCWDREIKEEKKKMTVEELVRALDKKSFFTIREPHKRSYIYQSLDGNETNWEKIKVRKVLQVTPDSNGFLIFVAPPVGQDS